MKPEELSELLDLQSAALEGFANVGKYMVECKKVPDEVVEAWHIIRDWLMEGCDE